MMDVDDDEFEFDEDESKGEWGSWEGQVLHRVDGERDEDLTDVGTDEDGSLLRQVRVEDWFTLGLDEDSAEVVIGDWRLIVDVARAGEHRVTRIRRAVWEGFGPAPGLPISG